MGLGSCLGEGTPSGMLLRDAPLPPSGASPGLLWEGRPAVPCPTGPPESCDPSSEAAMAEDLCLRRDRLSAPFSPVAAA